MTSRLPDNLHRYRQPIEYFVHLVTCAAIFDSRIGSEKRKGIPVRNELMKKLIGKGGDWSAILRTLRGWIIDSDDSYSVGRYAKGYWLMPEWEARDTIFVPITDRRFIGKLASAEQTRRADEAWSPIHHRLEERLMHLTIDPNDCRRLTCRTTLKHRRNRLAIDAINQRQIVAKLDPVRGRFYTNVTGLRRSVRRHLRFDGEPMVDIDVSHSQPLILGILASLVWTRQLRFEDIVLAGWQYSDNPDLHSFGEGKDPSPALSLYVGETSRFLHNWDFTPIDRAKLPNDLRQFLAECEAGTLRPLLAEIWDRPYSTPQEQLWIKKRLMVLLYGEPHLGPNRAVRFASCFPTMALFLNRLKERDHRIVACASTRIESELMLDGACGSLLNEDPTTPIATIHDAILTTGPHVDRVVTAIDREYVRFGVKPMVKVTEPAR